MSSKRKGVSPLVSVALLMIVVLAASSVLASNINMSPYLPPEDVEKNRLLESVAIVDVLEDAVNTPPGTVKVTVYILNNGLISANISAIYIGDPVGNLVQANTSVNRAVSAGEAIGIVFYRPTAVNWTTFLAVTARGNFASFLLGSDNTQTPDYVYVPGFMIGYHAEPIPLEGPPYTAESLETILEYIHKTLNPRDVIENKTYTYNIKHLQATGNKIKMQLDKNGGEGFARFLLYNPSTDTINISIERETSSSGSFAYVDIYFYNFSSGAYEIARHITDEEWGMGDIETIYVPNAENFIQDNLFSMQFVLNDGGSGTQFKFNLVLDATTSVYTFNAEYIVTLSDPDPSLPYVRGALFELTGTSNIPGNYSLWICNFTSSQYDFKLAVSNSSGTFDSMYLSDVEHSYLALFQGEIFDYIDSGYNLKYMIVPEHEPDQNLVLTFSSMHVELFIQTPLSDSLLPIS